MANCTVTLNTNTAAISGAVKYEPMPNQAVAGTFIDSRIVDATASANAYTAVLIQGAKYRIIAPRFTFDASVFRVPDSSTADLVSLIDELSKGTL